MHHFSVNHEDVSSESYYDSAKRKSHYHKIIILDLLLKKSNSFECQVSLLFFALNDNKLSSHMAQISEHIDSSNQKFITMIK